MWSSKFFPSGVDNTNAGHGNKMLIVISKQMQQAEMEMVRHQEANLTALAAIGPRKKRKIEDMAQVCCATFKYTLLCSKIVIVVI